MKTKVKVSFVCQACGTSHPQWAGQCSGCGEWNRLAEEKRLPKTTAPLKAATLYAPPSTLTALSAVELEQEVRLSTGLSELDHVLGGGLVSDSVVLIGGDPGIGKSTLLLQVMGHMAADGHRVMVVTGEESLSQVAMRAQRLGHIDSPISVLAETHLQSIINTVVANRPSVLVIDSIQTVVADDVSAGAGSVSQVRESAGQLVALAKTLGFAIFLIGHVTKEGALAGPRVLEHMVDTVLYFEGQRDHRYRVMRAVKNRFGSVGEIGIFAMTSEGLKPVSNPSAIFLSGQAKQTAGSVVMVTWEGTRPLLVEIQALVDSSQLGNPRRVTIGLEQNRLAMLLAVMHRHAGIPLADQDVFINAVGGLKISETGADLAILFATLSSFRDRVFPADCVLFGEVGLAGELRPVSQGLARLRAAQKHGFKRAIIPRGNWQKDLQLSIQVQPVSTVAEAIDSIDW